MGIFRCFFLLNEKVLTLGVDLRGQEHVCVPILLT